MGALVAILAGVALAAVVAARGWSPRRALPPARRLAGLPNGRLVPIGSGLVLLARPDLEHVQALAASGAKLLISEVQLSDEVRSAIERAGVRVVTVPVGSTLHYGPILGAARSAAGQRVAVHCTHGVDRTGATAALLLHCLSGVGALRALWSVLNPTTTDRAGLVGVLEDLGLPSRPPFPEEVGIYSGARSGGQGGLKVRGAGYVQLVETTLEGMERCE